MNSGTRFNEGFDGEPLLNECGQNAAWWVSVWFIWAVAWFSIQPKPPTLVYTPCCIVAR